MRLGSDTCKNPVCVCVCVNPSVWYLCVELLSQVGEQVFISVCCFTVKPHNMIRTLDDPFTNKLHDAVQTGLLHT